MKKAKIIYDVVLLLIWLGFPVVSTIYIAWASQGLHGHELAPLVLWPIAVFLWICFWGAVYGSVRYLIFRKEKTVAGTAFAIVCLSACAVLSIWILWLFFVPK